jgi:hypothetical protein
MSLAVCGQASAGAAPCGHAGPASEAQPTIAAAIRARAERKDGFMEVLMSSRAHYRSSNNITSVQTPVMSTGGFAARGVNRNLGQRLVT